MWFLQQNLLPKSSKDKHSLYMEDLDMPKIYKVDMNIFNIMPVGLATTL